MGFLNQKVREDLTAAFQNLKARVTLQFFTQELECRFCKETRELLDELKTVSEKVKVEEFMISSRTPPW